MGHITARVSGRCRDEANRWLSRFPGTIDGMSKFVRLSGALAGSAAVLVLVVGCTSSEGTPESVEPAGSAASAVPSGLEKFYEQTLDWVRATNLSKKELRRWGVGSTAPR